jgi:hypothetical protein
MIKSVAIAQILGVDVVAEIATTLEVGSFKEILRVDAEIASNLFSIFFNISASPGTNVFSSIQANSFGSCPASASLREAVELAEPISAGSTELVLKVKDFDSPRPSELMAKIEIVYEVLGVRLRIRPFQLLVKAP